MASSGCVNSRDPANRRVIKSNPTARAEARVASALSFRVKAP